MKKAEEKAAEESWLIERNEEKASRGMQAICLAWAVSGRDGLKSRINIENGVDACGIKQEQRRVDRQALKGAAEGARLARL